MKAILQNKSSCLWATVTMALAATQVHALSLPKPFSQWGDDIPEPVTRLINSFWESSPQYSFSCQLSQPQSLALQLPHCIEVDPLMNHLTQLQYIADVNQGNRAVNTQGYTDSVDYVIEQLSQWGYHVDSQSVPLNAFSVLGEGTLKAVAPLTEEYVYNQDYSYAFHSEPGDVLAFVQPIDLELGIGNNSTSGCETEDFIGFEPGKIALIQRGTCTFQLKAENAAKAGASAVIIFNQGNTEDRKDLIEGTLGDQYSGGIPVMFATYDQGVVWQGIVDLCLWLQLDAERIKSTTLNLIAQTKTGNANNVIMLGAHLDSVASGPGINDNGSGVAAVLELAKQLSKAKVRNQVRFAFWGAEESGLVGSTYYVQQLTDLEKNRIKAYLNLDMIASPNFTYGIYDGDGSDYGLPGPAGSASIERTFEYYFSLRGLPYEPTTISFRSDYAEFFVEGIPFGGVFSGAENKKSWSQFDLFGGSPDEPLDPCYHTACDDILNINKTALEVNADAAAFVTGVLAYTTKSIDREIAREARAQEASMQGLEHGHHSDQSMTHWGKQLIR